MKKQKRLYRSEKEKMIAGICGGIAEHLETDPTIIRLLWAVGTLFYGIGLLAYLIAWIIIPEKK
jgi:phage shock protein C